MNDNSLYLFLSNWNTYREFKDIPYIYTLELKLLYKLLYFEETLIAPATIDFLIYDSEVPSSFVLSFIKKYKELRFLIDTPKEGHNKSYINLIKYGRNTIGFKRQSLSFYKIFELLEDCNQVLGSTTPKGLSITTPLFLSLFQNKEELTKQEVIHELKIKDASVADIANKFIKQNIIEKENATITTDDNRMLKIVKYHITDFGKDKIKQIFY